MVHKKLLKSSLVIMLVVAMLFSTVAVLQRVFASEEGWTASAHVQDIGWMDAVSNIPVLSAKPSDDATPVAVIGTTGEAKRLEALDINVPEGVTLEYRAHVAEDGWEQGWRTADDKVISKNATSADATETDKTVVGTVNQYKRMEAVQIAVSGEGVANYEVYYRAHVAENGWLPWVKASTTTENADEAGFAGTTGEYRQMEALEIVLVHINHTYDYVNNEDGTHTGTCTVCGATVTENHEKELGETTEAGHTWNCTKCDFCEVEDHNFTYGYDEEKNEYTKTCGVCGFVGTDEEKHILVDAKAKAEAKIDEFVGTLNTTDYSEENMQKILEIINESSNKLHDATTPEEAAKVADEVIEALKAVKSNSQLLADAKAEAEAKIDEYVGTLDTTDYSEENMQTLLETINEASNKLHDATTPEEAAKVADEVIEALKAVKSNSQLLADAKAEAEAKIDEYVGTLDTTDYQTNMDELLDLLNESSNKLHDATTPEEAAKVADEVIEALKAVKSDSQLLADAKAGAEAKIDEFVGTLNTTDYSKENMQTLLETINEASNRLHDATTPEEAAKVAEDVIAKLDAIETFTDVAIANASGKLSEFVENSDLKKTVPGSDMDYAGAISDAIAEAYNKINSSESVDAVDAKLAEAENDILNALRTQVQFYLDTVYNQGKAYNDMVLTETKYNFYKDRINNAESISNVIFEYEYALSDRYSLSAEQDRGVKELTDFVESSDLKKTVPGSDMDYAAVLSSTIAEQNGNVQSAESREAVDKAVADGKASILSALKEQLKFYLDTLYNNGEAYQDKVLTEAKYQAYLSGINEAETVKDAIDAYENAERERYSLSEKISEQVNKLTEFVENSDLKKTVPGSDMDYAATPDINGKIAEGYALINSAKNAEEAEANLQAAENNIAKSTKEYVEFLLDSVYNDGKGYSDEMSFPRLLKEVYDLYKNLLNSWESYDLSSNKAIEFIIKTYETALGYRVDEDQYNCIKAIQNTIEDLRNEHNAEEFGVSQEAFNSIVKEGIGKLNNLYTGKADKTINEKTKKIHDEVIAKLEGLKKQIDLRLEQIDEYVAPLNTSIGDEETPTYLSKFTDVTNEVEEAKEQVKSIVSKEALDALMPEIRQKLFELTRDDLLQLLKESYYTKEYEDGDITISLNAYRNAVNSISAQKKYADLNRNSVNSMLLTYYGAVQTALERGDFGTLRDNYFNTNGMLAKETLGELYVDNSGLMGSEDTPLTKTSRFNEIKEIVEKAKELSSELETVNSLEKLEALELKGGNEVLELYANAIRTVINKLSSNENGRKTTLPASKVEEMERVLQKNASADTVEGVVKAKKAIEEKYNEIVKDFVGDETIAQLGIEATEDGNITVTVNDDGTLSIKADKVKVEEDMVIEEGMSLEISGSLTIEEGKKIEINENASLTLDNTINAYDLLKDKKDVVIENNGDLTLYAWDSNGNGDAFVWACSKNNITGDGNCNIYVGKGE